LLTFTPGSREAQARLYVHDRASPQADVPAALKSLPYGWHEPAEHKEDLRVPFVAPPPDTRPAPPTYNYTPAGKLGRPARTGGKTPVGKARTIGPTHRRAGDSPVALPWREDAKTQESMSPISRLHSLGQQWKVSSAGFLPAL